MAQKVGETETFCRDVFYMGNLLEHESFVAITAMSLQHHLGHEVQWDTFIQQCHAILKPGGWVFLREPYLTPSLKALRWMSRHSMFYSMRLLKGRLRSLREEIELLDYFLAHGPEVYQRNLARGEFQIVKDFSWMGHRIVVGRKIESGEKIGTE